MNIFYACCHSDAFIYTVCPWSWRSRLNIQISGSCSTCYLSQLCKLYNLIKGMICQCNYFSSLSHLAIVFILILNLTCTATNSKYRVFSSMWLWLKECNSSARSSAHFKYPKLFPKIHWMAVLLLLILITRRNRKCDTMHSCLVVLVLTSSISVSPR